MQSQRRRPPEASPPIPMNSAMTRSLRPSNRNSTTTPSQCYACSQPIYNPLLSNVLDRSWHPDCVRCVTCRCLLNDQCYSREGKLYCKDDFIKKYIHRCFSCQNLIRANDFIRRVRAGRIYHADCLTCVKCKRILQTEDINILMATDHLLSNELDYLCQSCTNPLNKSIKTEIRRPSSSNADEEETTDSELSNTTNGKKSSSESLTKSFETSMDTANRRLTPSTPMQPLNPIQELEAMQVDHHLTTDQRTVKVNKTDATTILQNKETIASTKSAGRPTKARQNSNSNKRTTTKSKSTTSVSRQKQTDKYERKGRSPATRSKSSANNASNSLSSSSSLAVQTRSKNRRTTKTSRYRKRQFSSGSDDDDDDSEDDEEEEEENDDDDDDDDGNFTEEDETVHHEKETKRTAQNKAKPMGITNDKLQNEEETVNQTVLSSTANRAPMSLIDQASESVSLLNNLSSNSMPVPSLIRNDAPSNLIPSNFNPNFPTPSNSITSNLPFSSGFSLQPRLPMPPPPGFPQSTSLSVSESLLSSQSLSTMKTTDQSLESTSNSANEDSPRQIESGATSNIASSTNNSQKPSALSSLLEFGTLPASTLPDIRPPGPANPYPFPFVTPGPGVPFSPQAAAGMTTIYRAPFVPPTGPIPMEINQQSTASVQKKSTGNTSKKKSKSKTDSTEFVSQNLLDEPSATSKKQKKTGIQTKRKKKDTTENDEKGEDNDESSPPPKKRQKKQTKKKTKNDNSTTSDDSDKTKNDTMTNPSQNLLAQIGLTNNSPSVSLTNTPPSSSVETAGSSTTPSNSHQQQAQIAAMYNMTPNFGPFNTYPGPFNPSFPGAPYSPGYQQGFGFHPAFPFVPPSSNVTTPATTSMNTLSSSSSTLVSTDLAPTTLAETPPPKSRAKTKATKEKKKSTVPRSPKKKSVNNTASNMASNATSNDENADESVLPPSETTVNPEVSTDLVTSASPQSKKRSISGTESEELDEGNEEQQTHNVNGKSGHESDGSTGGPERTSKTAAEKKGGRTTIKPQQLEILCKAFESCAKPNKNQREKLADETGLNVRVIQVWFQNKRSKERKGKLSKEKETTADDDDGGEDSQPSSPAAPPTLPTVEVEAPPEEIPIESKPIETEEA